MKNFINSTKGTLILSFSMVFILIFISAFQCGAQSRTTLSQEEKDAIDKLFSLGYIGVKADGWEINPDLWNMYNFQQRKNFTEKLSVFYKNYTEIGKQMSGFCYFYNMATKKKIARWYKNEYKEY
jgi:hypothetical protein